VSNQKTCPRIGMRAAMSLSLPFVSSSASGRPGRLTECSRRRRRRRRPRGRRRRRARRRRSRWWGPEPEPPRRAPRWPPRRRRGRRRRSSSSPSLNAAAAVEGGTEWNGGEEEGRARRASWLLAGWLASSVLPSIAWEWRARQRGRFIARMCMRSGPASGQAVVSRERDERVPGPFRSRHSTSASDSPH
jgi:hypothetical protein